jgi:hypothetical protein
MNNPFRYFKTAPVITRLAALSSLSLNAETGILNAQNRESMELIRGT